jgi:hypothetical protein
MEPTFAVCHFIGGTAFNNEHVGLIGYDNQMRYTNTVMRTVPFKKSFFLIIGAVLIWAAILSISVANSFGAGNDQSTVRPVEGAVGEVVRDILRYFTPVSGTVERSAEGGILVRFDGGADLLPGSRLEVFRKGEPFRHPVTGEPAGFTEDHVGIVSIASVRERGRLYDVSVIRGEIREGDIARISVSRVPLAFFQRRTADWSLSEVFYEALKSTGRFNFLEKYTPDYEPDHLSALSRELGARAFLLLDTPMQSGRRFLNVKIFWTDDAMLLTEINRAATGESAAVLRPEERFLVTPLTDREPWGKFKIKGGLFLATGDVDRDGGQEIVVSDGSVLRVYSIGEDIQEKWRIRDKQKLRHLSLDVFDLNGNGIPEIFVTAMNDAGDADSDIKESRASAARTTYQIRSYVVEYEGSGQYRKTAVDLPYFFRVSGGRVLMQGFDSRRGFSGLVREARWDGGRYVPGDEVRLPDGVNIYGFTEVDWRGDGKYSVITFDDDGYLVMYDHRGERVWRSPDSMGRFDLQFAAGSHSLANPERKWAIRSRLVTVRTARGQEVVLLRKIPVVPKVPKLGSKGARVIALWWDGASMVENLILDGVPGSISDFRISEGKLYLVAKNTLFSFVKNAVSGELERGSMLYYYDFGKHPRMVK